MRHSIVLGVVPAIIVCCSVATLVQADDVSTLVIHTSMRGCQPSAYNESGELFLKVPQEGPATFELPPGVYDIKLWCRAPAGNDLKFIVREGIEVGSDPVVLEFDDGDAPHEIDFDPRDETGSPLETGEGYGQRLVIAVERGERTILRSSNGGDEIRSLTMHVSDLSDRFKLKVAYVVQQRRDPFGGPLYAYFGDFSDGVDGDRIVGGSDSVLNTVTVDFNLDLDQYDWEFIFGTQANPLDWTDPFTWKMTAGWGGCYGPIEAMEPPYRRQIHVESQPSPDFSWGYLFWAPRIPEGRLCTSDTGCPGSQCAGPYQTAFVVHDGGFKGYLPGPVPEPVFVESGPELPFGAGPAFFLGALDNAPGEIRIQSAVGAFMVAFIGQIGEVPSHLTSYRYSLFDGADQPVLV